ncbi:ATP-binding cassette domain-containing protein [bacterium]|nr:MAG: ATP-binding cassette domain-containing protein [bacterium]
MESLLRVINLSKSFGTLPAIQQVSFEVQSGEVVGLTGSIGSGKSVLAMLLAGLYDPTEGEIYFANKRLSWPYTAYSLGINVIHQRATLNDQFDVVSNIFLGNEIGWPTRLGGLRILDRDRMDQETIRILTQLGIEVNSIHEKVINLSGEQRQMIAIARVLTHPARMVIIDEPTVLLSYPYQQRLLGLIQSWRQQGVAVLFSSSNLDHLFAVTDRIIILDQGRKAADLRTDETTREVVVSLLLGTADSQKPSPAIWDFDSYDRIHEHAEKMRYHQMLLGKNLAAEDILHRQLIEQLTEQVQSLDQANLALLEALRRLLSEREQERKHLARELHDQIIQDLLSVNYELEEMKTEETILPGLANDLSDVHQGIRELIDNLRRMCGDLRPLTIDSLGLGAALQSYTRDWSARTGIQVVLNLDANLGRLPEATELSIFRIVQEGLNNVWRHAQASCVQVSLQHSSPRTLMVSLRDDGLGLAEDFDLASLAANGHYGLIGIGERVTLLGGRFRLQRLPEGGSLLLVEIPHPRVDVNPDTAT